MNSSQNLSLSSVCFLFFMEPRWKEKKNTKLDCSRQCNWNALDNAWLEREMLNADELTEKKRTLTSQKCSGSDCQKLKVSEGPLRIKKRLLLISIHLGCR